MNYISRILELHNEGGFLAVAKGIKNFFYWRLRPDLILRHVKYIQYRLVAENGVIMVNLDEYDLLVDVHDKGIALDLLIHGEREPITSSVYERMLPELDPDPLVLEIGANIGYYALKPLALREDAIVMAVEPAPDNVDLLTENVKLNGFLDMVLIDQLAFGDESGRVEMIETGHSNLHHIREVRDGTAADNVVGRFEVDVERGETWVGRHGYSVDDIDVLRMDVEGFEVSVLKGLPEILTSVTLVHMEIHPKFLTEEEIQYLSKHINNSDLELVASARGNTELKIDTIEEAFEYDWVEMVLFKQI